MPIPILDGPYGGVLLALTSSVFIVGMDASVQDLVRNEGVTPVQAVFVRMVGILTRLTLATRVC